VADNTTLPIGTGGDSIATDDLATLNGAASGTVKVQRVKAGFGIDGDLRDVSKQFPFPVDADSRRTKSFSGWTSTFRVPGRASTTGQKIFTMHNATGSSILVDIDSLQVAHLQTVIMAATTQPPVVRLYRLTALPAGGVACTKVAGDTSQTSSASLTILQDAVSDGNVATTILSATLTTAAVFSANFSNRMITAAGFDNIQNLELLKNTDKKITLRPLEGIAVMLETTTAVQNPTTDMWVVSASWTEYTTAS
jgi:hypothetical protein